MVKEYSFLSFFVFAAIVFFALWLDLYAHKNNKVIPVKDAALWSVFWIFLALGFSIYIGVNHGAEKSSLFLTGYLIEKSLSIDNLFVFMAIFSAFGIKEQYQHRILYYGIIGALILRMVFIAAGSSVLFLFDKWALGVFAIMILWSALKMWQASGVKEEETVDYTKHWSIRLTKRFFAVHPFFVGNSFFTKQGGKLYCTPMFLCLIIIELADVMFALDSIPAILAITQEPFLVYTSNIFAILGLRSMYFLLSAAKRCLCYLEKAVILVLVFIGIKMLLDIFNIIHLKPNISLLIIGVLLFGGTIISLMFPLYEEGEKKTIIQN